jgi:hypothetical protein
MLADAIGLAHAGATPPTLGCIMYYCRQFDLPPLTVLVMRQTGIPGPGLSTGK